MRTWPDPFQHFEAWFAAATQVEALDVPAMALATATPEARPSLRIVYFKGLVAGAFSFYTNYNSRKGQELAANANAALLFYWQPLARQIRIGGIVQKLSREVSERYFASRSLAKQISASISAQSSEIPSYQSLQEKFIQVRKKIRGANLHPLPPALGRICSDPTLF